MRYYQRFNGIHISHFNTAREYELFAEVALCADADKANENLMRCLEGTHGHSLCVDFVIESDSVSLDGYLVASEELEAIVNELRNRNLSVHPWFVARGFRATTENIVDLIHARCAAAFGKRLGDADATIDVTVWETAEIYASQTWPAKKEKEK